jgi:hypothetical protein
MRTSMASHVFERFAGIAELIACGQKAHTARPIPKFLVKRKSGENENAESQPSIATDASNPFRVDRKAPGCGSLDSAFAESVAESGCWL